MHIDLWIGRTILGRYEKTGTSWLGNFAAGNIRYGCITAGRLLEKSSMVFGITAGGYLCLYWPGVQEKVLDMGMVW